MYRRDKNAQKQDVRWSKLFTSGWNTGKWSDEKVSSGRSFFWGTPLLLQNRDRGDDCRFLMQELKLYDGRLRIIWEDGAAAN